MCVSNKYIEILSDRAKAMVSAYTPYEGIGEYNIIAYATDPSQAFADQLSEVRQIAAQAQTEYCPRSSAVFKRYFLSDATNQAPLIGEEECATSLVGQPPLMGGKVAVWIYMMQDVDVHRLGDGMWAASHSAYDHIWIGGAHVAGGDSEKATFSLLEDYAKRLGSADCTLADNCLRTWFFVRDIDVNYKGVVAGRNRAFSRHGLTADTHFIASTGIGGDNADTGVTVAMDAYAVHGIDTKQVTYLQAPTHLNPTLQYGVAFERATAVDYGDRRHVLISGTASINNRGEIVHEGDAAAQTLRMLENIEALLLQAGCQWHHVTHGILYLRDLCDYNVAKQIINDKLPGLPVAIVAAPVCRPGWLVEMECMAMRPATEPYAAL